MGFCRTGLFKRLESSGYVFLLSMERHILRNYIYIHAIENGLPIPIGTQDSQFLDSSVDDEDDEGASADAELDMDASDDEAPANNGLLKTPTEFTNRAAEIYQQYQAKPGRFKWLRHDLFDEKLKSHLEKDAKALQKILKDAGDWHPNRDCKLSMLAELIQKKHPTEKLLIFTQFADTARYLRRQLATMGVQALECATGQSNDPTALAYRFSPVSNAKPSGTLDEIRVLIATDVLSEGQNLQDSHIVVNYDLPWAIIRLIQRAGRVDRIGQKADSIFCYSFLPADGVEKIIKLRSRVRTRLKENAEVVGADEAFFEDQSAETGVLQNLYTEQSGILDGDADAEVDLCSHAWQIWKNAIDANPSLENTIKNLPDVVYSTMPWQPSPGKPDGVMV